MPLVQPLIQLTQVVVFQIWKWLFSYSILFPRRNNREPSLSSSNEQTKRCGLLRDTIPVRDVSHLDGSVSYSGKWFSCGCVRVLFRQRLSRHISLPEVPQ